MPGRRHLCVRGSRHARRDVALLLHLLVLAVLAPPAASAQQNTAVLAGRVLDAANERAELVFTFTDIFNDFALQHDITGNGFTALYQNFLETQVATLALRFRF
jgi:hypothetical protein